MAAWENKDGSYPNPYFDARHFFIGDESGQTARLPLRNDSDMYVYIRGNIKETHPAFSVGYAIFSEDNIRLYSTLITDDKAFDPRDLKVGAVTFRSRIPKHFLNEGTYRIAPIMGIRTQYWFIHPNQDAPNIFLEIQGGFERLDLLDRPPTRHYRTPDGMAGATSLETIPAVIPLRLKKCGMPICASSAGPASAPAQRSHRHPVRPGIQAGTRQGQMYRLREMPGRVPGHPRAELQKKGGAPGENYYLGSFHSIYTGTSCDFSRRYSSSSGGLVSEVLLFLLENRMVDAAILTGFAAASALQPEGFLARNREDVLAAAGSKYSPVPLNVLLRELDFSKRYAYVGLPCHIQGLDLFLRQRKMDADGKFIKLGLFCSRTNRLQATKLLLRLNGLSPTVLKGIRYRGGGHPGFFSTVDRCGNQKKIRHLDDTYWGLLFKKYFVQYRCWLCPDKTAFFSDLSFGDDWSRSFYEDIVGTSSVIARSERGDGIIQHMQGQGRISLNALDPEQLIRSQALPEKMNI